MFFVGRGDMRDLLLADRVAGKVVCAENLMSDPRLLYKQCQFCEKQKELTNEFKAKVTLYTFPRCFQKDNIFLKNDRLFPRITPYVVKWA